MAHRAGSKHTAERMEGLQKPYIKTAGNILTPVQAFENGVGANPPAPTARGYTKEPGSDPFPSGGDTKQRHNPLGAFGLGGKD
jgi:hypothetical protein